MKLLRAARAHIRGSVSDVNNLSVTSFVSADKLLYTAWNVKAMLSAANVILQIEYFNNGQGNGVDFKFWSGIASTIVSWPFYIIPT